MGEAAVAVATSDGELSYRLREELRKQGLGFILRRPEDPVPLTVKAVLTTEQEARRVKHHTVIACRGDTVKEAVAQALRAVKGLPSVIPEALTVGIDPGKTVGYAALLGRTVVQKASYRSLAQLKEALKAAVTGWGVKKLVVKVGGRGRLGAESEGSSYEAVRRVVETVAEETGVQAQILLVDERDTTAKARRLGIGRRERDEASALEIAFR
jgi:RNase H-fold protein (predicted Holliday junction resolvase)